MARGISPQLLKAWLGDGAELALLDAREEGEFGASHLFWAVNCPLSQAELRARALLPRRGLRVVCLDGGEGLAERLAAYLERGLGCTEVHVLEGGTPAWEAAGFVAFSGVNVPSKAFGEWVEHHYGTPSITAEELSDLQRAGADMVVLDSRPRDEFFRMSIPGAVNLPGGELAFRIGVMAPRPETLLVVNCAGRTRSILGAESLRRAGIPNRVVALRNGTMGWELAGFSCDRGRTTRYPEGVPPGAGRAREAARRFAAQSGVRDLAPEELLELQADGSRSLYVLDVRSPEEFAAGHLPGSRSAPGGQLVQATDRWVAARHARLVLVDDDGVRARMTGAWLAQMGAGFEVHALQAGPELLTEAGRGCDPCPEAEAIPAEGIAPVALAAMLEAGGAVVVDLARSVDFREGHVPGAQGTVLWGIRTRLSALAPRLPKGARPVVTAPDPRLALLAVPELLALTGIQPLVLAGGLAAWRAAGLPVATDRSDPPDAACLDIHLRPYDRNEGQEAAMSAYLAWEVGLMEQVARDGGARFGPPG
jgi:rhodanese-related sulfurtransferase